MTDLMSDLAPLAAMIFVALCILWLAWRAIRHLFRSPARIPDDIPVRTMPDAPRREPSLAPSTSAPSAIPDAADVLALKASIDALARQIGALERRLAPANTNLAVAPRPRRESAADNAGSPGREPPAIVPDRRI